MCYNCVNNLAQFKAYLMCVSYINTQANKIDTIFRRTMNRIDKIHEEVKKNTLKLINEYKVDDNGISALEVSLDLKLDRANVSKDLNTLWKNDVIIKVQNHPVLFLDR